MHRLRASLNAQTTDCLLFLLRIYDAKLARPWSVVVPGTKDATSARILRMCCSGVLQQYSPRSTVVDGNCAFRAVSLALFDTEDYHSFISLVTACEMILHPSCYYASSSKCLLKDDRIDTPPLDQAVGGLHVATGVISYMSLTCHVVKLTTTFLWLYNSIVVQVQVM